MSRLNLHWLHRPPAEWPVMEHKESRDETLLEMVNRRLTTSSNELFVKLIGSKFAEWQVALALLCDMSPNDVDVAP